MKKAEKLPEPLFFYGKVCYARMTEYTNTKWLSHFKFLCLGIEQLQFENVKDITELRLCLPEPVVSFIDVALKELKFSEYAEVIMLS